MKFTITLNFPTHELHDIEIEAPDANRALDEALQNLTNEEVDDISSFVIVGIRD